jgi:hypothetical protein
VKSDHQNCNIEQSESALSDKRAEKLADVVHFIFQRIVARELKKMLEDPEKPIGSPKNIHKHGIRQQFPNLIE